MHERATLLVGDDRFQLHVLGRLSAVVEHIGQQGYILQLAQGGDGIGQQCKEVSISLHIQRWALDDSDVIQYPKVQIARPGKLEA